MSDIADLKHIAKFKLLLCDQIDKSNLRLLSYNEIMIVLAIADLSGSDGCLASDVHNHKLLRGISRPTIQRSVASLKALNLIESCGGVTNRRYMLNMAGLKDYGSNSL